MSMLYAPRLGSITDRSNAVAGWGVPGNPYLTLSTFTTTNTGKYAQSFAIRRPTTVYQTATEVSTGVASSTAIVTIWRLDARNHPTQVLWKSEAFSTASTAQFTWTANITLEPGLYAQGIHVGGGAAGPQFRTLIGTHYGQRLAWGTNAIIAGRRLDSATQEIRGPESALATGTSASTAVHYFILMRWREE